MPLANEVKCIADEWRIGNKEISALREKATTQSERCNYLRFQLNELTALQLSQGEWENLEIEHKRLAHADELLHQIQSVTQQMTGE